ncbi:hypothetical protein HA402_005818 [Bradysia odoriphaga]|nr:hypothetical protein HA402_005818 [Bradysia odoriphaga]
MWKALIFSVLFAGVALGGIIHDHYEHHDEHNEHEPEHDTDHEHKVEHEHATSHQSFKIHHFHAVPVYVKKEDQKYLKHPVEISGVKHKLKLVHPETEKSHGHGLVLENHTEEKNHKDLGHHEHHEEYNFEPSEQHDFGGESSHDSYHQYHDINLHHHSD